MKKTNPNNAPTGDRITSVNAPPQVEDAALKLTSQYFADVLVPYFHIEGEVDHIGPTESVHLELKKMYQDINLVMKDGSWVHFEFQGTNDKALDDLKRFRVYEALTSRQHRTDVRTYVLFSGTIENPMTEFTCGFNTYRVHPIIMKGHRAEEVFENISHKLEHSIPLTREDLVPLTLCPLMGGSLPQKERIQKAFRIVSNRENNIPDTDIMEAVIFAMASKFLNETDYNQLKEEIKMTELGMFIYNDGKADGIAQGISQGISQGIAQGISQASIENAKKLFGNGVSYELVRASIDSLTDKELQEIYNECECSRKHKKIILST